MFVKVSYTIQDGENSYAFSELVEVNHADVQGATWEWLADEYELTDLQRQCGMHTNEVFFDNDTRKLELVSAEPIVPIKLALYPNGHCEVAGLPYGYALQVSRIVEEALLCVSVQSQ